MERRGVLAVLGGVTHRSRAVGRPVVVFVALVVVSVGGLWLRFGTDVGPPPDR